jgi:hypothetical protein
MKVFAAAAAVAMFAMGAVEANAIERYVTIVNASSYDIHYFYASNRDARSWEEDILGDSILPSGRQVVINIDDGTGYCIYDFRVVFEDGDVLEKFGNNVCELDTFTYTD